MAYDISDPEFCKELEFWVGHPSLIDIRQTHGLTELNIESIQHDFGVSEELALSQAGVQSKLRENLNDGVDEEFHKHQRFYRQGLVIATHADFVTPIASLTFADNTSASKLAIPGLWHLETYAKSRVPSLVNNRYHYLGWRAINPEVIPNDPEVMSHTFTAVDILLMHSFYYGSKDFRQPLSSYPWLGPRHQGERWWTASLRGMGMHVLEDRPSEKVKSFPDDADVKQEVWGGQTLAHAERNLLSKAPAGRAEALWAVAQTQTTHAHA